MNFLIMGVIVFLLLDLLTGLISFIYTVKSEHGDDSLGWLTFSLYFGVCALILASIHFLPL